MCFQFTEHKTALTTSVQGHGSSVQVNDLYLTMKTRVLALTTDKMYIPTLVE